jgi:polynucleotide 5'-kinase involved in rRNA processing
MAEQTFESLARELSRPGVYMLIGGLDTGKTTLAMQAIHNAVHAGQTAVLVDADVGRTTVGPPTCVGMRVFRNRSDLDQVDQPDALHFVGTTTPARLVLQQVVATAVMTEQARRAGQVVIIDTTAVVTGVSGETLKYHKTELCRPDRIVSLQRGEEMEPLVGMLRRFLDVEVTTAPTDPAVDPMAPDERARRRADAFRRALRPPLVTWKVRPTVFAPTLPVGLNPGRLDGVLVGVQDKSGGCLGLGVLSHDEETLKVLTNVGEGMSGLRLGSIRLDLDTYESNIINLRELMFGI